MLGKGEGADKSDDDEEDPLGGRRVSRGIAGRVGFCLSMDALTCIRGL